MVGKMILWKKKPSFLRIRTLLRTSLDVERETLRKVESDLTAYGDSEQDVVNLGKAEDRLKEDCKATKRSAGLTQVPGIKCMGAPSFNNGWL